MQSVSVHRRYKSRAKQAYCKRTLCEAAPYGRSIRQSAVPSRESAVNTMGESVTQPMNNQNKNQNQNNQNQNNQNQNQQNNQNKNQQNQQKDQNKTEYGR